jgi:biopolymer transport protein ExbD
MSGHTDSAEPDLTPILDMVFQLITFFMMVINFKSAALDMTLKLPVIGSAMPVDTKGEEDVLVMNLAPSGRLSVYGQEVDVDKYVSSEAESSRQTANRKGQDIKPGDDLPTIVVIRSDESTAFKDLYKVVKACQDRGFRNFSLKAKRPT